MKILNIHAESDVDISLDSDAIKRLAGKKIGLVTTIQHLSQLNKVQKQLKGSVIAGQVLGCDAVNAINIKSKVDAFLYIGSGRFHPINVAEKTGKKVYTYDPFTKHISRIDDKDIESLMKRKKGALLKFLTSETIGIIVSTKPGQNRMKDAEKLYAKLKKEGKKVYMFMVETLDINQLVNFPFIQCYVNTACPRIFEDVSKGMINIDDIPK